MIPFCDNILCKMHEIPAAPKTEVLEFKITTYTRYELPNGLHVCDICMQAINISKEEIGQ